MKKTRSLTMQKVCLCSNVCDWQDSGTTLTFSSFGLAVLAGWLTRRIGIGMTLLITPMIIGGSDLIIPLAGLVPHLAFPLVGLAQFLFGLARPILSINQVSLRQAITPERLQGRMNATVTFVVFGLPTLGALLGGILGQYFGLPGTLVIAAAGEILACVWIVFSPVRTLREEREWPKVLSGNEEGSYVP